MAHSHLHSHATRASDEPSSPGEVSLYPTHRQSPPPPYHHSLNPIQTQYTRNINTSHTINIPPASTSSPPISPSISSRPATPSNIFFSSTISSLSSSKSTQSPKRKANLQVHWHPSVNQRQGAKRNRQIFLLLSILLTFSSLTLVIYHYAGCDISTGRCKHIRNGQVDRISSASSTRPDHHQQQPQHGLSSALSFGGKGLFASTARTTQDPDSDSSVRRPWSFLYVEDQHNRDENSNRKVPISSVDENEDEEEYMEDDEYEGDDGSDEDRVEDYILGEDSLDLEVEEIPIGDENMEVDEGAEEDDNSEDQEEVESRRKVAEKEINVDSAQMMLIMDDENEQIQEVVAAVEESDEDADEDGQEQDRGEGDLAAWEEDDTPQEAYVDMWSESSAESLSDEDYLELEDDYVVQQRNRQQSSQSGSISSSSTLQSRLDPSTKYMVYLPSGGLTFQFYGMLRALMLSKSLGRTLILPPITASGPQGSSSRSSQSWSDFFDLDTFMYLTGAKVKELKDLRELSPSRAGSSERLRCHITCGVGSLRPLDYTAKEFLRQWKFDLSLDTSLVEATTSTGFNGLVQSLRVQDENEPSLVCITNAFKVDVPAREDWDLFGRYLYFTPRIQKYFAGLVQALGNGLSSSSPTSATVRSWQELMHAQRKYVNDQGETPARAKAPLYHNELDNLQDSAVTVDKTKLIDFQNREKSSSASDGSHNSDDNNISNNNNGDDISNESTTYNDYYLNHNTYANSKVTPPLGPFIAIHVVRGTEFSEYCQIHYPPQQRRLFQQHQIASSFSSCLPTAQELALKLHSTQVLNPQLRGLPVYVIISSSSTSSSVTTTPSTSSTLYPNSDGNLSSTTIFEDEDDGSNNELFSTQQVQQDQSQDERRGDNMDENYQEEEDEGEEDGLQREMDEFRALGWHVLDHQKMGTRSGLGLFGARMIEQMFMARAQVLIGVRASSEARIGAYRQEDWYGRRAVFM